MTVDYPQGGMFICRPKPIPYQRAKGQTVQGLTLMSDLHIGARNVDYALIKEELETAKKNKDRILLNGDVFDMILIQDQKRFRADVLHPRLASKPHLVDAAVDWGAEILMPYADLIDMIGVGNHEESIVKHHGSDVIKSLIEKLRRGQKDSTHLIHYGGYCGFIDYRFRAIYKDGTRGNGLRYVVFYHHGSGGAAPVTKGMIDFSRKQWAICNCIWMGHKHNRLLSEIHTVSCPQAGHTPTITSVRQIMTGAYFNTYQGQSQNSLQEHGRVTNYAADMGLSPQGKGGARLLLHPGIEEVTVQVIQ